MSASGVVNPWIDAPPPVESEPPSNAEFCKAQQTLATLTKGWNGSTSGVALGGDFRTDKPYASEATQLAYVDKLWNRINEYADEFDDMDEDLRDDLVEPVATIKEYLEHQKQLKDEADRARRTAAAAESERKKDEAAATHRAQQEHRERMRLDQEEADDEDEDEDEDEDDYRTADGRLPFQGVDIVRWTRSHFGKIEFVRLLKARKLDLGRRENGGRWVRCPNAAAHTGGVKLCTYYVRPVDDVPSTEQLACTDPACRSDDKATLLHRYLTQALITLDDLHGPKFHGRPLMPGEGSMVFSNGFELEYDDSTGRPSVYEWRRKPKLARIDKYRALRLGHDHQDIAHKEQDYANHQYVQTVKHQRQLKQRRIKELPPDEQQRAQYEFALDVRTEENDLFLVCEYVRLAARTHDERGENWGYWLEFYDRDGAMKSLLVTEQELGGEGNSLFTRLAKAGLSIQATERDAFRRLLRSWESSRRITICAQPGWYADLFLSPTGEIIHAPGSVIREVTHILDHEARIVDTVKVGTLEGWKAEVVGRIWDGDTPQFALGQLTGVAGAIVSLITADTFGVHFKGPTSTGKSTSQMIAASIVGNPAIGKGMVINADASDDGLAKALSRSNATGLHLDEAKTAAALKTIERRAYGIANDSGKTTGAAASAATWKTVWTLSSEPSLQTMIESSNRKMLAGAGVRLLHVDVGNVPQIEDERASYIRDVALKAHYGWALPVFIQEIMRLGYHKDAGSLRARVAQYASELPVVDGVTWSRRASKHFGALRASGEIMKGCGLIPEHGDVAAVVGWAWESFCKAMAELDVRGALFGVAGLPAGVVSSPRGDADASVAALLVFLGAPTDHGLEHITGADDAEPWAWVDEATGYVRSDKLARLPGVTSAKADLLEALRTRRLLVLPASYPKNWTWTNVPGGPKVAHYRIKLPRPTTQPT